jgi:hypothetical protein
MQVEFSLQFTIKFRRDPFFEEMFQSGSLWSWVFLPQKVVMCCTSCMVSLSILYRNMFSEVYNVVRQVSSCKVSISMDLNALPEDFACGSSPFYRRRSHVSLAKHIDHDHLLYYYLNRKLRFHVNFEGLETLTLIVEKEKEIFTHHCHYNFFN